MKKIGERIIKHGHARRGKMHPNYSLWSSMIARCEDRNNPAFPRYGGRGIKVCERWRSSFANFLEDMGERPKGRSIDRIDNDGDYTPENCRWATATQQALNRRSTRYISVHGRNLRVSEWASETGISQSTIYRRLRNGWSEEEAVTHGSLKPWLSRS